MKSYGRIVLFSVLALSLAQGPSAWCITPIRDGDPGTIGWALTQKDGARITLPGELVARVGASGQSFAIKEAYVGETTPERLICVSASRLPVKVGWCVTVTGTLRTVSSRKGGTQRVLLVRLSDVVVACSANNRPVLYLPYKMSGAEWANMVPLSQFTTRTEASTFTLQDVGLPPMPDTDDPEPSPPAPGSRDSLKWLPDGAQVSMNGAIVTAAFSGFFYAERQDRSFGTRVDSMEYVWPGELVDISGQLETVGGERRLIADSVVCADETNTYTLPLPVGLPNRALGGGAVGPFTPAVADSSGLNNTGLLVRTWGTVTHTIAYCTSGFHAVYLDDGSGVQADIDPYTTEQCVGVKVYIPDWSWPPDVDTYQIFTGVSAAETPEGASSSIRVLYAMDDVIPSTTSGSGTISGTVTATGADGKTVRVYCGKASTTAVFSGNSATYTLTVPAGDHAVTASVVGYKTITQFATVTNSQQTTKDFALTAIGNAVEMMVSPARVPPDGVSEITITAIAHDLEGRRLANESVSWNTDVPAGQIISADSQTDAVGEARMVVCASTSACTGTVEVTISGAMGRGFPEFAKADAPGIRILQPSRGDTVGGEVEIQVQTWDHSGTLQGVASISIFVDGVRLLSGPSSLEGSAWPSYKAVNGAHEITATVMDFDGNTLSANVVPISSQNNISAFSVSPVEMCAGQPVHVSATLDQADDWAVAVEDIDGFAVWSATGHSNSVSVDWPGTTQCGLYNICVTVGSGDAASQYALPAVLNPTAPPSLLIVAGLPGNQTREVAWYIARRAAEDDMSYAVLMNEMASWDRIRSILSNSAVQYLYMNYHGLAESWLGPVTQVWIDPGGSSPSHILYAKRLDGMPASGEPDLFCTDHLVAYASELGRTHNPLTFVWMHACYSGRIGGHRPTEGEPGWDDFDYGKYGLFSCYDIQSWNDMAAALGITAEAALETACGYVGWYGMGSRAWDTNGGVGPGGITYSGLLPTAWGTLANGYSFDFTRDWIHDTQIYTWSPREDNTHLLQGDHIGIKPYYNWRFFGNPNVPLF